MELDWAASALDDVDRAQEFLESERPQTIDDFVDRLTDAVETLLIFPNLGRPGRIDGTRELVIPGSPWLIVYRVTEERVQIARVIHHARRWPSK